MAATLGPLHKPRQVLETDHVHYIAMARDPFGPDPAARTPPYCYRLLAPLLASALTRAGLGLNPAFWLVSNLGLVGFLFCAYLLLLARGFPTGSALLGVALAGLVPGAVRWYEYQYWMSDPLGLFLLALGLLLVGARRDRALALLGLPGVAARESFLLVYACLLASRWRRDGLPAALAATARVAAPGLALLAAIHALAPTSPAPALAAVVGDALGFRWRHLFDNQLYLASLGAFGVLVPGVLVSPRRALAALAERPEDAVLAAGAYASLLLGTNTDRLLAYALPAALPVALAALQGVGLTGRTFAACLVVAQGAFYVLTPFHGIQGLSLYQPTHWTVVAVMAAVWLVGRALARPRE